MRPRGVQTCSFRMRSSMVPAITNRTTWIGLYWPSLWIRSCACACHSIAAGEHRLDTRKIGHGAQVAPVKRKSRARTIHLLKQRGEARNGVQSAASTSRSAAPHRPGSTRCRSRKRATPQSGSAPPLQTPAQVFIALFARVTRVLSTAWAKSRCATTREQSPKQRQVSLGSARTSSLEGHQEDGHIRVLREGADHAVALLHRHAALQHHALDTHLRQEQPPDVHARTGCLGTQRHVRTVLLKIGS